MRNTSIKQIDDETGKRFDKPESEPPVRVQQPGSATWEECEAKFRAMREQFGKDMPACRRLLADYSAAVEAWAKADAKSPNS